MINDDNSGTSPYASGGGGVELEHQYAASALASLLLAQPIEGLGDEFTLTEVSMQQGASIPVDDVVIRGSAPGGTRSICVACRRHPTIGKSDSSTVRLFADFMKVVLAEREALTLGRLRLGLAVAGPHRPATELSTLTDVARRQPSPERLAEAVNAPGAYSGDVRARLNNVRDLVEAALIEIGKTTGDSLEEHVWTLLKGLYVISTQFEGDIAPGRTQVVARLQTLTGDSAVAEQLWFRLVSIAAQGAIRAAAMTRSILRGELRSFGRLDAAPDFAVAAPQVALLESELRARTGRSVPIPGAHGQIFTIDRDATLRHVIDALTEARSGSAVVIHGEPDVGKSALALQAADSIRGLGGAVLAMSLRDLPSRAIDLKAALGLAASELFAAAPSASATVVILDGAEVVQERDAGAFGALASAAARAGHTVVAIVRDDGLASVIDALKGRGIADIAQVAITALSVSELEELVSAIPQLSNLACDSRSNWLLARIGLVELLLRTAERGAGLPGALSSEAEVFATVWSGLIRQGEQVVDGVAPDDREMSLLAVAQELVTSSANTDSNGHALAQLRSDGILLSRGRSAVWETGDRFASDVLRDFAAARLLVRQGIGVLTTSSAPRWAVRATRLFAQSRLLRAATPAAFALAWEDIQSDFAALAAEHGARWAELPWEALLTAGWASRALDHLTPMLVANADLRNQLIRTVMLRFSDSGACDPIVAEPVVEWFVANPGVFQGSSNYDDEPTVELIVRWLRGVARLDATREDVSRFRNIRVKLRDLFVATEIDRSDKGRLEALALLGEDRSDASVRVLTDLASVAPGFLAPVVESFDVATTLGKHNPALLVDLACAFYIERPSNRRWRDALHGDGIRGHQSARGLDSPLAAWYLGPFGPLLQRSPSHGLRLINRMLDQSARAGLKTARELDERAGRDQSQGVNGIEIDVLGLGLRTFVGGPHLWSWYRGSSVGPYPCMSALMALELCLDDLASQGLTPAELARAALKDATTLASLGLVFGFLVRHFEDLDDELESFLAHPGIWELEFGRVSSEGQIHVQRQDPQVLVHVDRRRWSPLELSTRLVVAANQRGDQVAVERLRSVGQRLVDIAGGAAAPPQVHQWAAHLDINKYSVHDDGQQRVLKVDVPESAAKAMQPIQQRVANTSELIRLLLRYRAVQDPPYRARLALLIPDPEFTKDYRTARKLEEELAADEGERWRLLRALGGVAAAVIQKGSQDGDLPDGGLEWALELLTQVAIHFGGAELAYERSFSPDGPDRQAALALPLVLAAIVSDTDEGEFPTAILDVLRQSLCACLASPSIEVRHFAADGLRVLSQCPCKAMPDGQCWHELLWTVIETGARKTVLGERVIGVARSIEPIVGDLHAALAARPDGELMLTHIAPVAIAALDATAVRSCIADRTWQLGLALTDSLSRSARHWADQHYEWRNEYQAAFAAAVLRRALAQDGELVLRIARQLASSLDALGDYLHALAIVATHESEMVTPLTNLWPQLMAVGLGAIPNAPERRHPRPTERVIRSLVPKPSTIMYPENTAAVIETAQTRWLSMAAISQHIDEWLAHAHGEMSAVDSLVGFLKSQPIDLQVCPGLDWVRSLVVGDDGTALTCGFFLVGWLSSLRDSRAVNVAVMPSYRVIVDALVLENYRGARDLQRRDE